jgi:hypothetical protein
LLAHYNAGFPFGINLAGLMKKVSLNKKSAAAYAKCEPASQEAGDQANAGAGSEGDPSRPLAAPHVERNGPGGCNSHPNHP